MQWVAQCINGSMYLGILPTTADPNMLIHITVSSPFFAPALCWCALQEVLSMLISCRSASILSSWNIFSKIPYLCHFAKHYRDGGIGIKHLADLWVYCKKKPQLNKAYLRAELDKLGLATFFENVMMTCAVWFDAAAPTEMTDFLTKVIANSGAYGKGETKRVSWAVRISGENSSGKTAHLRWKLEVIFLPYWKMCLKFPVLKKLPVLLPFFWVVRWGETLLLQPKNIRKQMDYAKKMRPEDIEQYRRSLDYVGLRYHNGEKCPQEPADKALGEP